MAETPKQSDAGISPRLKEFHVRTMNSDIKSIKEQGGGEPKPYVPPSPQQFPPPAADGVSPSPLPNKGEGSGGPGETFQPPQVEPKQPPTEPPKEIGAEMKPPQKPNKKLFVIILVVLIIIAVGVVGYFFVIPLLGGEETPEEPALPQDEAGLDETIDVPIVPPIDEVIPPDEEEPAPLEEGEEGEEAAGEIPAEFHVSLFTTPTDTTAFIEPSTFDLEGIKNALAFSPTEVPLFREVVLKNAEGNMLRFETVMQLFAPTVFTNEVAGMFEPDATLFTYTDDNGTWLGIAARVVEGTDRTALQNQVALLENNTAEIQNFYFEVPTNPGTWQDGSSGNVTSRYLAFEQTGASFNYGWADDVLLMSTSYPTFQEAVNRL